MTGGQVKVPIVLKAGYGFTAGWAGQHTGTINAPLHGVPGLKVVVPSTAADAKGLMATAIRDDNPVVYLHNYLLTLEHGEVPDGEYLVPFRGRPRFRREGGDVTIVATGWCVDRALNAAEELAKEGVQAEVIDPRTLAPLDTKTILESVEKTGRLVLVDQSTRHASAATVIAGRGRASTGSRRSRRRSCRSRRSTRRCLQPAARGLRDAGRGQGRGGGAAGARVRARDGVVTPLNAEGALGLLATMLRNPAVRGTGHPAQAGGRGARPRPPECRPGGASPRRCARSCATTTPSTPGHRAHGHAIARGIAGAHDG